MDGEIEPTSEQKTVTFKLMPADLRYWGLNNQWVTEPGQYEVYVGNSSAASSGTTFTL